MTPKSTRSANSGHIRKTPRRLVKLREESWLALHVGHNPLCSAMMNVSDFSRPSARDNASGMSTTDQLAAKLNAFRNKFSDFVARRTHAGYGTLYTVICFLLITFLVCRGCTCQDNDYAQHETGTVAARPAIFLGVRR